MDWGLDDDFPPQPANDARPPDRELVPEGDHVLQIREVIDHGEKVEFRMVHDDRRFGWVFAHIPKEAAWGRRILSSLRKACGMTREQWAAGEITDLVDRRVGARIYHKAGNGRTFVNVAEFRPQDEPGLTVHHVESFEPPKSVAKRTATQKADAAARMPDDDIPF